MSTRLDLALREPPMSRKVGSTVTVIRTGKQHVIVKAFQSNPESYYKLDNGTHYWEHEFYHDDTRTS